MHAFVPVWRVDTDSARTLYKFSDALDDDDVIKAVEQVRHQRAGTTQMPPWLQALAGYAWLPSGESQAQWVEHADEVCVLKQLLEHWQADASSVAVFENADELSRQLRLRLLVKGFDGKQAQSGLARLCDGSAWQPHALSAEKESAAAVLTLATGRSVFAPWQTLSLTSTQACEQALALAELHEKDWI